MEQYELLQYVADRFGALGLRYFVTGSVATVFYGEPRFTNDIDVVVKLTADRMAAFCRAFPSPEFYLSEDAVRRAVSTFGQFNIIHPGSGMKIDVIVADDTPFNRERFLRAARISPAGQCEAFFASAEDVIIKKMEYYRDGGSEKHLRDIAGVLKISGGQVDRAYISSWASRLALAEIWNDVLGRMETT